MKRLRMTLSTYTANRLLKGEKMVLETRDESTKKTREFIIKILEVTSDIPRCNGCTIRLDTRQSYKFGTGVYCWDCFQRRIEKHKDSIAKSDKKTSLV
jgi:hypothetical protein